MRRKMVFSLSVILFLLHVLLLPYAFASSKTAVSSPKPSFTQNFNSVYATYINKEIVISLGKENLTAYDGGTVFLQTPVTTGGPDTPTPLGVYHVLKKLQNFMMHSPWPPSDSRWYPDSFINYGLLFERGGYFIHDAPWRNNFGFGSNLVSGVPGGSYTGSHGCVNVPLNMEAALYSWASVGTIVIVEP